jgi:Uma2 family endonuclease
MFGLSTGPTAELARSRAWSWTGYYGLRRRSFEEDPMPARPKVEYTYDDYLATPEDSSQRYEIVDGKLFVTAAPRFRHQLVVTNLAGIMRELALRHELGQVVVGPVMVHLADDAVTEPDLVFVRADRMDIVDERGIHGAPDVVVEVLSPSNRSYDRTLKRKRYMASGVAELWIVDADARTVEVWRPGDADPTTIRESLRWSVADETFAIALTEILR